MKIFLHKNAHIPKLVAKVAISYNAFDVEVNAFSCLDVG